MRRGFAECEGYSVSNLEVAETGGSLLRFSFEQKMNPPNIGKISSDTESICLRKGNGL